MIAGEPKAFPCGCEVLLTEFEGKPLVIIQYGKGCLPLNVVLLNNEARPKWPPLFKGLKAD